MCRRPVSASATGRRPAAETDPRAGSTFQIRAEAAPPDPTPPATKTRPPSVNAAAWDTAAGSGPNWATRPVVGSTDSTRSDSPESVSPPATMIRPSTSAVAGYRRPSGSVATL